MALSLCPWLQIALIALAATFFRLWQIDSVPPGLFGDEAVEGLDALDVLAGRGQVFFPANYGREGLYIWLVAGSLKLFGVTPLAVRLPAIVIGVFTCLVAWWLAREWWGETVDRERGRLVKWESSAPFSDLPACQLANPPICRSTHLPIYHTLLPLFTGLYLATAYWHVSFSRFSQRTILTPLFVGLAVAAFWRGVNLRRTRWFLLAGAGMGLALHSYSVGRFFPVLLVVFLVLQCGIEALAGSFRQRPPPADPKASHPEAAKSLLAQHGRAILLMFLVAAVIFAPLGVYFLTHPGSFMQRASVVATYAGGNLADTLALIGRAALANLAQYVLPGAGDRAQFHNLPGRPIFEPLTALLAVAGLLIALRRWREPRFLFLLLWLAILTAPAALATDRFPTLPRVLGVLPGLYLLPALGLIASGQLLATAISAAQSRFALRRHVAMSSCRLIIIYALLLGIHAGAAYRDYFRAWGPSQATFDAFDGDMTAAWQWLRNNQPQGLVYLSSDIYRHPTFMLLNEQATVQTIFTHRNASLSWFDARMALPLPTPGQPAAYLIGSSAQFDPRAAALLADMAHTQDRMPAPDSSAALTVYVLPAAADLIGRAAKTFPTEVRFTDRLTLVGARFAPRQEGVNWLTLTWRTDGPDPQAWRAYRLEVAGLQADAAAWQDDLPFDMFRPPEWTPGGHFITWHKLDTPNGAPLSQARLRLLQTLDHQPVTRPDAADGWHTIPIE